MYGDWLVASARLEVCMHRQKCVSLLLQKEWVGQRVTPISLITHFNTH